MTVIILIEVGIIKAMGIRSKMWEGKYIEISYLLLYTKFGSQMEIAMYYATTCQQLKVLNINLQFDNDDFINM